MLADAPTPAVGLCDHAAHRARQMGVDRATVEKVLADPDLDYPAAPGEHDGRRIAVAGRLEVPYAVDPHGVRIAVTVLWRGADHR